MPRVSVFIATSVDGYIARPDGGLDWLSRVELPGEDYGYAEFFATIDVLVMGRATYDFVAGLPEWPYGNKRVVVLTHRADEPRPGAEFFAGGVQEVMAHLGDARRVYIDGGNVIRQFLAAGVVSDLTLSVIPVILGDGIRLFDRGIGEHALVLESQRAWSSGLVQLRYRAA